MCDCDKAGMLAFFQDEGASANQSVDLAHRLCPHCSSLVSDPARGIRRCSHVLFVWLSMSVDGKCCLKATFSQVLQQKGKAKRLKRHVFTIQQGNSLYTGDRRCDFGRHKMMRDQDSESLSRTLPHKGAIGAVKAGLQNLPKSLLCYDKSLS